MGRRPRGKRAAPAKLNTRGGRYKRGYPESIRDQAVRWLQEGVTLTEIGRRLVAFARVNLNLTMPPVPRSTLRTWAAEAGLAPRRPGRPRKA
jgi:hypothetical protein